MNTNNVIQLAKATQPGSFRQITWESELDLLAAYKGRYTVTKRSVGTVRFGVNYENITAVKAKRFTGELPVQNTGLPWGEWKQGYEGLLIEHKGQDYLRCATSPNVSKVEYLLNGRPTSLDVISKYVKPSALKSKSKDVFNVKVSNIISIK